MAIDDPWTCDEASICVDAVVSQLARSNVLMRYVSLTTERALARCGSCRRGRGRPQRCTGWDLRVDPPLTFRQVDMRGTALRVELSGVFRYSRSTAAGWVDWKERPLSECSAAISVVHVEDDSRARNHLDLANRGQAGTVWHLQLGGGSIDKAPRWATYLRWPALPLDFALACELILFNFYPDEWIKVRGGNPWREWIQRSENLVLSHYRDRFTDYWDRRDRLASWLSAQCNQTANWDPRAT